MVITAQVATAIQEASQGKTKNYVRAGPDDRPAERACAIRF